MSKLLISIAARAGSKGFRNKNLKIFCEKPLVYYSLSAAELFLKARPDIEAEIVLNTDSEQLIDTVSCKYPNVEIVKRPEELGGDRVSKMSVHQYTLAEMQRRRNYTYDYFMDLDVTSPLRTAKDVQNVYELAENRDDLDVIFSVTEARRNPYFNMVKTVDDHAELVVASTFTARQQAPDIYDVNASCYMWKPQFLITNTTGLIWDGKIGITKMMDTGILDIDSEDDFLLMEAIAWHLYKKYPDFEAVRNNIK
ncbi:MAG: acylneuraminate cytidylyltransferase family protein [Oscillospiraceae bacterium]